MRIDYDPAKNARNIRARGEDPSRSARQRAAMKRFGLAYFRERISRFLINLAQKITD
jgi:hypothetical protein